MNVKKTQIEMMFENITEKYEGGDKRIRVLEAYEGEVVLYFDRNAFSIRIHDLEGLSKWYLKKTTAFILANFRDTYYGVAKISYNPLNTTTREVSGLIKAIINYLYTVERPVTFDEDT